MLAFAALAAQLQALHGQPQAQVWALQRWLPAQPTAGHSAWRLLADQPPPRVLMAHRLKGLAPAHSGLPSALFEACLQANGGDVLEAFCLVLPDASGPGVALEDWCDKHQPALAALPKAERAPALLQALAAAPTALRLLMGELATGRWRSPMPLLAVQQALAQARGVGLAQAAWLLRPQALAPAPALAPSPVCAPQPEAFVLPVASEPMATPHHAADWQALPLPEGEWAQCGREGGDAWLWTDQGQLIQPFACALPAHSLLLGRWNGAIFHALDGWRWEGVDGRASPLRTRWAALQALPELGPNIVPAAVAPAGPGPVWWRRWDAPVGPAHAGHWVGPARRELQARCVYLRSDGGQWWAALALAAPPGRAQAWVTVAQVEVPAHAPTRQQLEQATKGPGALRVGPVRHLVQPVQVRFSFDQALPNPKRKCGWELRGARWEGLVEPLFQAAVPGVAALGQA